MQKRILSVHDISCLGKCSNTAALPILSAAGHECVILPTALLSTHTGGFVGNSFLDLTEEMKKILRHWETLHIRFDAVYTGYFGSAEQLTIVRDYLRDKELLRFIDPVLGDCGELYNIYDDAYVASMREYCRGADVLTPNMTEACLLAGLPYCGDDYEEARIRALLDALFALDVKQVVLTGIRFGADEIGIVVADCGDREISTLRTPYADIFFPGTGDTFASALCARLVAGTPFREAAKAALDFTYRSIQATVPTEIRYGLCFEEELKNL